MFCIGWYAYWIGRKWLLIAVEMIWKIWHHSKWTSKVRLKNTLLSYKKIKWFFFLLLLWCFPHSLVCLKEFRLLISKSSSRFPSLITCHLLNKQCFMWTNFNVLCDWIKHEQSDAQVINRIPMNIKRSNRN